MIERKRARFFDRVWRRTRSEPRVAALEPRAVYDRVIRERRERHEDLKRATLAVLYLRNKIEGEVRERRQEIVRAEREIRAAVREGEDRSSLALIAHKRALIMDLERLGRELEEARRDAEKASRGLVQSRDEMRSLERERLRAIALAHHKSAWDRCGGAEAIPGDGSRENALERIRTDVARLVSERSLEEELAPEDDFIGDDARVELERRKGAPSAR